MNYNNQTPLGENPQQHRSLKHSKLFLKGPIPFRWLQIANSLGGSTGIVATGLWFYVGINGSKHFKIDSNFYTIDVNFEFDSSNTVLIEIGDGQVSGLDYRFNATNPEDKFYTLFKEMVNA